MVSENSSYCHWWKGFFFFFFSTLNITKNWSASVCSCVLFCFVTFDRGIVAILLAVAVLLSIRVLLCVLQTQFMTNLERLANCPHNTHCLALGELGGKEQLLSKHDMNLSLLH